jgi:DNA polymerase-3 subunit gamma/tau
MLPTARQAARQAAAAASEAAAAAAAAAAGPPPGGAAPAAPAARRSATQHPGYRALALTALAEGDKTLEEVSQPARARRPLARRRLSPARRRSSPRSPARRCDAEGLGGTPRGPRVLLAEARPGGHWRLRPIKSLTNKKAAAKEKEDGPSSADEGARAGGSDEEWGVVPPPKKRAGGAGAGAAAAAPAPAPAPGAPDGAGRREAARLGARFIEGVEPHGGKYVGRPSPPYAANGPEFAGALARGGDGHLWRSAPGARGVHRWAKHSA